MKKNKNLDLLVSLIPLVTLILTTLIITALSGLPIYLPLIISALVAGIIAVFYFKFTYEDVMKFIGNAMSSVAPAILILLSIGILASSFMYSGVVPSIMYYATTIISPQIFLPAIMIVTAIVAIAIGSSFTSISTIGVAFFATGVALGYNEGLVAGAIISGAMFGDKLSPLSDTTNISSMLAGTTLFKHIRNMFSDTVIAFILALIIFSVIGFNISLVDTSTNSAFLENIILDNFTVSPILALVPVLLIVFTLMKFPVTPSILLTSLVAIILGVFVQGNSLVDILTGLTTSTSIDIVAPADQLASVSSLFNRGGLESMLPTIAIVILATSFGGILRFSHMFEHIIQPLENISKTPKSTMLTALFSAIFVAFSSGEQYLSIILPTETFKNRFEQLNIRPEHLSRVTEAGGTVCISLVPWGVVGAFVSATLGVSPFVFIPLTFFSILTPIVTGIKILASREEKLINTDDSELNVSNKKVEVK